MTERVGKIPDTAVISLETQKEIWQNLNDAIVKNFIITGVIKDESIKKRIKIRIKIILSPELYKHETKVIPNSLMKSPTLNGFSRIIEVFVNYNADFKWTIYGIIEGVNKIPIMLSYYDNLDLCIYTKLSFDDQKLIGVDTFNG